MAEKDLSALRIDPEARQRRGSNRGLRAISIAIAVIAVVVIVWYLASRRPPEVEVMTIRAGSGEEAAVLNASGYVTPRRRATVSAKITGKVVEVLIEEGMEVEGGQVLARLDDSDAVAALRAVEAELAVSRAQLSELRVELSHAERTLARNTELRGRDLVSQEDLDNAETAVASFKAKLVSAGERTAAAESNVAVVRQAVDNCIVRAPFAGVVVSKDAQPGEMISPVSAGGGYTRTGIATIVDMESLEIEVDVNESYIARVTPGQRVDATLDAYPEWRIPSRVLTVIPTADRQKATVRVRITFDRLDPRILPDMGVKVAFLEGEGGNEEKPFVLVPKGAVVRRDSRDVVFVVRNGSVERRAVQLGNERNDNIEILSGLRSGERIVTGGAEELHDGQRIRIRQ